MRARSLPGTPGATTDEVMAQMRDLWPVRSEVAEWALGMFSIVMEMPPRLSARQSVAFALLAAATSAGRRVTMTDLRDFFGEHEAASGSAQSIAKSFQVFFAPSKQEPGGLDWVYQETDEDDRRKKYLYLTQDGADAVLRALHARKMSEFSNDTVPTE